MSVLHKWCKKSGGRRERCPSEGTSGKLPPRGDIWDETWMTKEKKKKGRVIAERKVLRVKHAARAKATKPGWARPTWGRKSVRHGWREVNKGKLVADKGANKGGGSRQANSSGRVGAAVFPATSLSSHVLSLPCPAGSSQLCLLL